jgi:hypothetical protein
MHKAGESIRSVEDVATVAVQATDPIFVVCACKTFFAVGWQWRGACDGSWVRACGTQHYRGAQSDEREGWDGLARTLATPA